MTLIVKARPLTSQVFLPFGRVIAFEGLIGSSVNEGRGLRFDTDATLAHTTAASVPTLALYDLDASRWPVAVSLLERHPRSAQLFLPLSVETFLVVVARPDRQGEPDDDPDPATVEAFVGQAGQGILYSPGIWHLPLLALERSAQFAMMMWQENTAADCDEFRLAPPLTVMPPDQ